MTDNAQHSGHAAQAQSQPAPLDVGALPFSYLCLKLTEPLGLQAEDQFDHVFEAGPG